MTAEELAPVQVGDALVVNGLFGAVLHINAARGVALVRLHAREGEREGATVLMTTFLAAYLREALEVPNLAGRGA